MQLDCLNSFASEEFGTNASWLTNSDDFTPLSDQEIELLNNSRIEGVYEEAEGLRFSTLKRFMEAPWYYNNHEMEPIDSKSVMLGTAFHSFLLERDKFEDTYSVFQAPINKSTGKPYLSGKAYDTALEEFIQSGKLPLNEGDRDSFNIMWDSATVSGFNDYLSDGIAELPLTANIDDYIVKCKIDFLSRKYGIVDIKTTGKDITNSHGDDSFRWEIRDRSYSEQLAYYQSVVESIIGRPVPCHIIVFETHKPFRTAHYKLSALSQDRAKNNISDWLETYHSISRQYQPLDWEI